MKPNHKDERGEITDLMVTNEFAVTHITIERGAVRGNHYHQETKQMDVIISGKVLCRHKVGKIVNETILKGGDIITHEPGEPHAYKAIDPTEMVSVCIGKRRGEDYSKDTYKLTTPLL